jgi:ribosomal protein L37AE/L43A
MNRENEVLLFKKLIKRYLPNESIQFGVDGNNLLVAVISGKKMVITLGFGVKWDNLKRRIDKALSEDADDKECHICEDFDSKVNNSQISCPKCANTYCMYCYIDMFKKNKGLILCPFCRFQCGNQLSEKRIAEFLVGFMDKLGLEIMTK